MEKGAHNYLRILVAFSLPSGCAWRANFGEDGSDVWYGVVESHVGMAYIWGLTNPFLIAAEGKEVVVLGYELLVAVWILADTQFLRTYRNSINVGTVYRVCHSHMLFTLEYTMLINLYAVYM
jgi:hypothetical protein